MPTAAIYGLAGTALTAEERAFFAEAQPWGFILFKRNIDHPDQVLRLTDDMRMLTGRDDLPVLIDQEGGRVQRMGPPHWPRYPSGRAYGRAAVNDPLVRRELTRLGARLMAADLRRVGINVDCVPVLDVPIPGADEVIGDRAYADDPETIGALGRAAAEGLLAGGVLPVIKHIPGHGRALADSHKTLPVVHAGREALEAIDFPPFRMLSDMPLGMSAHVVYTAIDPKHPATQSRKAVRLIREEIGFAGLLMTDDLSMHALTGDFGERAKRALRAGCDLLLHCNGDMAEMQAIAAEAPKLKGEAKRRAQAALSRLVRTPEPMDEAEARARFAEYFSA
ncbi:beta-N-acetylhexosaminidase [Brevundimonas sp. 2R-24]|uniref:beta-N-acetylhexosaminidase n=1 Tax=Peiella sedimenti TaxID=3061083 RepID=A0ABT8SIE8_9CAUL|nr:beta-N-acetylhexosaminidase [Caulobacteraceae bacterium XZ-24]